MEGAEPIFGEEGICPKTNVELLCRPVAVIKDGFVRHEAGGLAKELMQIYTDRAIRIAGENSYRLEQKDR